MADLVSRLYAVMQADRLRLPAQNPAAMVRELAAYEIHVDQNTNDIYGAFEVSQDDDFVTALGFAVLANPPGQQAWTRSPWTSATGVGKQVRTRQRRNT